MLNKLKTITDENQNEIIYNVRSGLPTAVFGVTSGEKIRTASLLDSPVLYVAPDMVTARSLAVELEAVTEKETCVFPPKSEVLITNSIYSKEIIFERLNALYKAKKFGVNVITTLEALMQITSLNVNALELKKGDNVAFSEINLKLASFGYKRTDFVKERGEYSFRGDVLDVFPINSEYPYRIEFEFDEVDKIYKFNEEDGKKQVEENEFYCLPLYEFDLSVQNVTEIAKTLEKSVLKKGESFAISNSKNAVSELIDKLSFGYDDTLYALMPIFKGVGVATDFFKNYTVVFDEGKLIDERTDGYCKEFLERFSTLFRRGEVLDFAIRQICTKDFITNELKKRPSLMLANLSSKTSFYNPLKIVKLNCSPLSNYSYNSEVLTDDLKDWQKCGYRVILCCDGVEKTQNITTKLMDAGIGAKIITDTARLSGICIVNEYLGKGFIEHKNKLVVIGSSELFVAASKRKTLKTKKFTTFSAPKVGDYAVHDTFGIGKVVGNKRISTSDSTKDYLEIMYRDGDMLYVPLDQMDRISKYIGAEQEPKLNKIGDEFERIKEKVKQSVSLMAINLKKLYKSRKERKGFAFSPDNEFSNEFDSKFEYELTEDQATAIAEVKADMESNKIMDRLICGDVGFGKTEVAMRAVFKAYLDGKQCAVVCPTTILSQQHYLTFKKRFDGFGAKIEVLNRFKSVKERDKIITKLACGDIDIVIGTHALFGKTVKFKDLGLLVLDEEQRFGVEHKEKIKTMKENVDTITLTATPIPRTLHMSLVGIRDISEINTPPTNRIPTQTFVLEQNFDVIVEAVNKEFARKGQAYILYNKVESIDAFAQKISSLLPNAKILVAHGQMKEKELEEKILSFYNGEFNLLIATTIIENGIDLPLANTLIVIDADKLGLSTLYQLRGRVGRSDRMAYAYFMYKQLALTDVAYKRLNALMEYSDVGSGYKIAMRDLQIRGAGNVLGKEQHGHMEKIGYELYSKLLKEKLAGEDLDAECETDCKVTAYIPETYIDYPSARMDCYKKIAEVKTIEEMEKLKGEIEQTYGEMPLEVNNLLLLANLKILCKAHGVIKVEINKEKAVLTFKDVNSLNDKKILSVIENNEISSVLSVKDNPVLTFNAPQFSSDKRLSEIISYLS